jgi:hypothetical protein
MRLRSIPRSQQLRPPWCARARRAFSGNAARTGSTPSRRPACRVIPMPMRLKAVLRIPETQTRDLAIGQRAQIDTRNGFVAGHVVRVDPAITNGTITVDVALDTPRLRAADSASTASSSWSGSPTCCTWASGIRAGAEHHHPVQAHAGRQRGFPAGGPALCATGNPGGSTRRPRHPERHVAWRTERVRPGQLLAASC